MSASGRGDRLLWPLTAGSAMLNVQLARATSSSRVVLEATKRPTA